MAELNLVHSRIHTLWHLDGRIYDSREILDDSGLGLLRGTIDISDAEVIKTEGYTKVEYHVHTSTGTVKKYATLQEALAAHNAVNESKPGAGFASYYVSNLTAPGIHHLDVYKEWEGTDPQEGQSGTMAHTALITGVDLMSGAIGTTVFIRFKDGSSASKVTPPQQYNPNTRASDWHKAMPAIYQQLASAYLVDMFKVATPAQITEIKKILGIAA